MGKTFRYIQNDDVLRTYNELKDTTLAMRPLVIARNGDYSLLLETRGDGEKCLAGSRFAR